MKPNVIIPMGGQGTRFADEGFRLPKPLIEVTRNKPMIRVVVENLGIRGRYYFLCLGDHLDNQPLGGFLDTVCEGRGLGHPVIVREDEKQQGQADAVWRVLKTIGPGTTPDLDSPVIVANCDQFMDAWHPGTFISYIDRMDVDGAVLTFNGSDPKWSFCRVQDEGIDVEETAEKDPISNRACVGVFYFKSGRVLKEAIEEMMADPGQRVNGEFYLAPVYNYLIRDGRRVIEYPVAAMHGLGTPEDLKAFQGLLASGKVLL